MTIKVTYSAKVQKLAGRHQNWMTDYVLTGAAAVSRKHNNYGDGDFPSFCFHKLMLFWKWKKCKIVLYRLTGQPWKYFSYIFHITGEGHHQNHNSLGILAVKECSLKLMRFCLKTDYSDLTFLGISLYCYCPPRFPWRRPNRQIMHNVKNTNWEQHKRHIASDQTINLTGHFASSSDQEQAFGKQCNQWKLSVFLLAPGTYWSK